MATVATRAPFRVGTKEIYLPNFKLTLKRTRNLPAHYASFIVPLWFSKLDLRDYLYHAYNVRVGPSIRSYVKQSRIRQGSNPQSARPQYKRWHRPRSTKHMTVELERPFVWPEEPDDFAKWNRNETQMAEAEQRSFGERVGPLADRMGVSEERRHSMREQAQALLDGKEKWKAGAIRGGGGGGRSGGGALSSR